jgi:MinD superfamily P-loop ATPase
MLKKVSLYFLLIIIISAGIYSAGKNKYVIIASECVGCTDCQKVCIPDAIKLYNGKAVIDPHKCTGCKVCIYVCSYSAVRIEGFK